MGRANSRRSRARISLADISDRAFALPAGEIALVHPLEMSASERDAWNARFAEYEIFPPIEQLARPVLDVTPQRKCSASRRRANRVRRVRAGLMLGEVATAGEQRLYDLHLSDAFITHERARVDLSEVLRDLEKKRSHR